MIERRQGGSGSGNCRGVVRKIGEGLTATTRALSSCGESQ